MREIVGSSGIAADIPSNQSHGIQLGKAVTSHTLGHTPNKLQIFLKENLKQLGVSEPWPGRSFSEERLKVFLFNLGWWGCWVAWEVVECWEGSHGGGLEGHQCVHLWGRLQEREREAVTQ